MPREDVARKLEDEPFFEPVQGLPAGSVLEGTQRATERTIRLTDRVFSTLVGTGLGVATGIPGGPPGMLAGGVAGAAGELVGQEVERRTGSSLKGGAAGAATDIGTNLLMSALLRRPSISTRRAGKALSGAGLLGTVGPEGASEVAEATLRGHERLVTAADDAWKVARANNTDLRVSSEPVRKAARAVLERMKGKPLPEKSQAALMVFGKDDFGKPIIGDTMGVDDAQAVLSMIADDLAVSAGPDTRFSRRSVGASELRKAANDVLDEIEALSPAGSDAVTSLRAARKATGQLYAAVPEKSVLRRSLVSDATAFDQPEKAMQAILGARQPVQEVQRIKGLIAGDKAAERGLKRVAIQGIFGRVAGGTGEVAPRTVGAAAGRSEGAELAFREILGDKGYDLIYEHAKTLNRSTRPRRLLPEVATQGTRGITATEKAGALLGGVAAYALGGSIPTGATAGALAGTALEGIGKLFGPNVARQVALEALIDPAIMKQVVAQAPSGRAAVEQVVESLVRRGILTFNDFAPTIEPHGTASPEAPDAASSAPRTQ